MEGAIFFGCCSFLEILGLLSMSESFTFSSESSSSKSVLRSSDSTSSSSKDIVVMLDNFDVAHVFKVKSGWLCGSV